MSCLDLCQRITEAEESLISVETAQRLDIYPSKSSDEDGVVAICSTVTWAVSCAPAASEWSFHPQQHRSKRQSSVIFCFF